MKKTPWFPENTHPARRGWYERDHRNCWVYITPADRRITRDLWEPVNDPKHFLYPGVWYVLDEPYWFYNHLTGQRKWIAEPLNDASLQNLPWRGLMEKSK